MRTQWGKADQAMPRTRYVCGVYAPRFTALSLSSVAASIVGCSLSPIVISRRCVTRIRKTTHAYAERRRIYQQRGVQKKAFTTHVPAPGVFPLARSSLSYRVLESSAAHHRTSVGIVGFEHHSREHHRVNASIMAAVGARNAHYSGFS